MANTHDSHAFLADVDAQDVRALAQVAINLPEGIVSTDSEGNWTTYIENIQSVANQSADKEEGDIGVGLVRDLTDGKIRFLEVLGNKGVKVGDTSDLHGITLEQDTWYIEEGDWWAEKLASGIIRQGGILRTSPIDLNITVSYLVPFPTAVAHVELQEVKQANRIGRTLRVLDNRNNPAENLTKDRFSIGVDVTNDSDPYNQQDNGWVTWMAIGY